MSIEESMVTPTGDNISNCGYCKTEDNSASYGVWAHQLTCKDYQMFINRGWRRSGAYLYKPNQRDSCCAAYAIRLDVGHFQLEKSHKKIIKKVNKYLHNGRIYHGNNTKTYQNT
ncbi:putative arginyl-tRNA--protein transferase 1 [Syncephalis fuscata]|nr:putative arginyl-tRNA--protein transferase 1 [Syncephalis fuscata]